VRSGTLGSAIILMDDADNKYEDATFRQPFAWQMFNGEQ
jgi:hypothetical protein